MKLLGQAKRFIAWMGLVALLLLGVSSFDGMVLCIESDGRVSLENAIGGICNDSFQDIQRIQSQAVSSKEAQLQAAHCKRCVDLPISIDSAEHQDQKLQTHQGPVQMPLMAETPSIPIGYLATATENQMPQPPPLRPAIHRFLNTVVLLI